MIEPDLEKLENAPEGFVEPHALNPMNVLRMARAMNGSLKRILLVGCEPMMLGGEEGQMSLSPPVEAAVDEAAEKIVNLTRELLQDNTSRNEFRDRGEAHGHGSDGCHQADGSENRRNCR